MIQDFDVERAINGKIYRVEAHEVYPDIAKDLEVLAASRGLALRIVYEPNGSIVVCANPLCKIDLIA